MSGLTTKSSDVSLVEFFGWASALVHLLRTHKSNRWPKKNVLKCCDRKNEWSVVNIFYDTYTRYIFIYGVNILLATGMKNHEATSFNLSSSGTYGKQ